MKISVAMCTYNCSRFVEEQLRSIVGQTVRPHEVVICDDASTDGTFDLLERFKDRHPDMIRLFRNDGNLGTIRNFEKAIDLCTGDLIFLSDGDDVFLPHKFERILREFDSDPSCGLVFSDAVVVDEELNPVSPSQFAAIWPPLDEAGIDKIRNGRGHEVIGRYGVAIGCSMAFRSTLRGKIIPTPPVRNQDLWITAIAMAFSSLRVIEEPLVLYRQHGGNQSGLQVGIINKLIRKTTGDPDDYYQEALWSLITWKELRERLRAFESEVDDSVREPMLEIVEGKILTGEKRVLIRDIREPFSVKARCILTLIADNKYGRYGRGAYDLFRDLVSVVLQTAQRARSAGKR